MQAEGLRALIECPVCFEVRRDPTVYQCKKSHNICKQCYDDLPWKKCPIGVSCEYFMDEGMPQRNRLAAESLVREWKHPCMYSEDYCSATATAEHIKLHEKTCLIGIVRCKHSGCLFEGRKLFTDMESHDAKCQFKPMPCKFISSGCIVVEKRKDLSKHEEECEWRKVPCPHGWCNEYVAFNDLDHHIRLKHKGSTWDFAGVNGEIRNWALKESDLTALAHNWIVSTFHFDGNKFVHRFQKIQGTYYYRRERERFGRSVILSNSDSY